MTASFVYCVNELERTAHVSNQIRFFCLQVRVSCINGMLQGSVFLSLEMYLVRMSIQHWGKEMSMKKGRDRVTTAVVSWLMHRYHILAYHRKNEDGSLKCSRRELIVNNRQHLANLQGDGGWTGQANGGDNQTQWNAGIVKLCLYIFFVLQLDTILWILLVPGADRGAVQPRMKKTA